ncbi:MAG: RHS repeat-associated core domain-containing protein, partial [Anaerolineae bacterium]
WTDTTPLLSGSYLSLRTDASNVLFDNLVVSEVVKYYQAGGQRVALRKNGAVSYLFGDHLGSTSVTADATGVRTGELWYKPWGENRGTPYQTTPTTYRFTGQREDASIGLYFYNARYYDPALGRFISADTIVPNPQNPQALNRYSYVGNQPVKFSDPTGMFSEDQLSSWYGKQWRTLFDLAWQRFLEKAEFGDAITFGDLTSVFVKQNHSLAVWSVNDRTVASVQVVTGNWDARKTNLWRPQFANQQGGASQNAYCLMPGEVTSPESASSFGTNIYRWVMGDEYASNTLTLPMDWYRGTNSHVRAYQWFAGFAQQDAGDIAGYALTTYGAYRAAKKASGSLIQRMGHGTKEGVGGLAGALVIAVDIFSKTLWDTHYVVESGPGTPPAYPAPRPPSIP